MLHLFTLNDKTVQLLRAISTVLFVEENFVFAKDTALVLHFQIQ